MPRVILWDFDGTLAYREGLWSGCLLETLDEHERGHAIQREQLIPRLQEGFPWHRYQHPHPELSDPIAWWRHEAVRVWMIGDNVDADVRGAEAVGIPAILVRRAADGLARQAPDLWGVIPIVEGRRRQDPVDG